MDNDNFLEKQQRSSFFLRKSDPTYWQNRKIIVSLREQREEATEGKN
jgi:hypothetical protein